jgi:hypothetical protein
MIGIRPLHQGEARDLNGARLFVVVGTDAGSKLARAETLGVTMLDETAFLRLIMAGT